MLRRLQVIVAIAIFAAGSWTSGLCEHQCGDVPVNRAASDCHGGMNAGPKIVDGHDCSSHTIEATPATRESRYELRVTAVTSAFEISVAVQPAITTTTAASHRPDPDPPNLTSPTPLRI